MPAPPTARTPTNASASGTAAPPDAGGVTGATAPGVSGDGVVTGDPDAVAEGIGDAVADGTAVTAESRTVNVAPATGRDPGHASGRASETVASPGIEGAVNVADTRRASTRPVTVARVPSP